MYGKVQKYHKITENFQKCYTPYLEIPHLQISRNYLIILAFIKILESVNYRYAIIV